MAIVCYDTAPYSTASAVSHYLQDGPHRLSRHATPYPLSQLYIKYIRRAWKRISRVTRKPERASMLPDGFVLINARLGSVRRRSALLA